MFRKVLLTITLLLLFLVLLRFNTWSLFDVSGRLQNAVLSGVNNAFGDSSHIESVDVGFGSVNLKGVELAFHHSPYELNINEVSLGYSVWGLLKGGGANLAKIADEITLHKPTLTIRYQPDKQDPGANLEFDLPESSEKLYSSIIKEYDFIKRITISDGRVMIHNTRTGDSLGIAKQINGYAYTNDRNEAKLRLAGHFFDSDEYNTVIYGQLNLDEGRIDVINLDLHDYKIGHEVPFLIPNYFDVLNGVVNGHLEITERLRPTRGFNIEGDVRLRDGQLKLKSENLFLEAINIEAEVRDWNLEIKHSSQYVNGSPVQLSGRIRNLLEPEFELHAVADRVDLSQFFDKFVPEKRLPISGYTGLDLTITESPSSPKIRGKLASDSVLVQGRRFENVSANLSFANRVLQLSEITGALRSAVFDGAGKIDFSTTDEILDFRLDFKGDFTEEIYRFGFTSADQCLGQSSVRVFGTLAQPVGRGQFELDFLEESVRSLTLEGSFNYNIHAHEVIVSANSGDSDFRFRGKIANLLAKHPYFDFQAENFEKLFVFINNPYLDFVRNRYGINLEVEGPRNNLNFKLEGFRRSNSEPVFEIVSDSDRTTPERVVGKATFFPHSPQPVSGGFEIAVQNDAVRLNQIFLGNWLSGNLTLSRDEFTPYGGELEISGLDFSFVLSLLSESVDNFRGELYGRIAVAGEVEHPAADGSLWLLDGFFRDVGPISGELNFLVNGSIFNVKKLSLENGDRSKVMAVGAIDLDDKYVDASVKTLDLNLDHLIKIITGAEDVVHGRANLDVTLQGPLPKVPLYGNVQVADAKILRFAFDKVNWDFGTVGQGNGSYVTDDELYVGHAFFQKAGEFVLVGSGHLPFSSPKDLDVHLEGNGNFLAMLTDVEPSFFETRSTGHLDLYIEGQYTRPRFPRSTFRFSDGSFRMTSVANRVENIEGEFQILPADYSLDIIKLNGSIQGRQLSISNTTILDSLQSQDGRALEPLRVAGDDLNLGALIINAESLGIPVNIPALMEPKEIGVFSLAGSSEKQPFFIAGPWQHPYVCGKIEVHDANLTFPFDESVGDEHSAVRTILYNLDWNVEAISRRSTRYVKQFSTGVYVNMEVQRESSQLEFSGILQDSTFRIEGQVISDRGQIEYLDLTFRVENFGAEFDKSSLYPYVYGRAYTVVRDTANIPYDVYLDLYTVNDLNQEVRKGRWDRLNIKLTSEHPSYRETQGDVMAILGYSSENMEEQATKAVAYSTDRLLFRPIMRPLERGLERALGLDVVRFSYAITQNFLDANFNDEQLRSSLELLRSSRLLLGKYLTEDVYLVYTGELKTGIDYQFQEKGVGLEHSLGLEFRLNAQWLLQMEYDYNTLLETHKDDKKVWLRHSFPF